MQRIPYDQKTDLPLDILTWRVSVASLHKRWDWDKYTSKHSKKEVKEIYESRGIFIKLFGYNRVNKGRGCKGIYV
jgi:hypothetical protein